MKEVSEVKDLTYWGNIYGTDKSTYHGYTTFYDKVFNQRKFNPSTILEIGIKDGASLKMWKQRFPTAIVIGVDINPVPSIENIITLQFDATDPDSLHKHFNNIQFDLIIDDGSHNSLDVMKSFDYLWARNLNHDGIYIYEDCHCSFIPEYNSGTNISAYAYIKRRCSLRTIKEYWKNEDVKTDSGTLLILS